MELVQGKATVLNRDTETHGHVSGNNGRVSGQISSMRVVTIDVGGQIVNIKHKEPIVVADGDDVVAAGARKSNGIQAFALANRSRSTRNHAPATLFIAGGGLFLLLGIPLSLLLVGLIFVAMGGYMLYMGLQMRKANALIDEVLSRASSVATG